MSGFDQLGAIDDGNRWRGKVKEIRACSMTWWRCNDIKQYSLFIIIYISNDIKQYSLFMINISNDIKKNCKIKEKRKKAYIIIKETLFNNLNQYNQLFGWLD